MASGLFVGIDAGTQGVKVLVWDQQANKVVSRGGCSYPLLPTTVPGRAEQHPSTWLDVRSDCPGTDTCASFLPLVPIIRAHARLCKQHCNQ